MGRDIVERLRARGGDDDGVVATVTYMTAQSIVRALRDYVDGEIDELFVCGGGAHNPVLMRYLADSFPSARVAPLDELEGGVPAAAKEAVMFALLGFLCVSGRQVPVSSVEEAKGATVMGKVTPGPNYRDLIGRAVQDDAGMLRRIVVRQA
jgi:1,6-anhydro-N-acetylmuramate kinase